MDLPKIIIVREATGYYPHNTKIRVGNIYYVDPNEYDDVLDGDLSVYNLKMTQKSCDLGVMILDIMYFDILNQRLEDVYNSSSYLKVNYHLWLAMLFSPSDCFKI